MNLCMICQSHAPNTSQLNEGEENHSCDEHFITVMEITAGTITLQASLRKHLNPIRVPS